MRRLVVLVVLARLGSPTRAVAQDAFELQVYDVETAPRGGTGLELHLNHHVVDGAPNETHLTFEPHYGLAAWAELGGYLQTAMTTSGSGDLAYAGAKLRLKLRYPRRLWGERLGLAINGELSAVPSRWEAHVWGSELRPVIDLRLGRVYAAVNPIVTTDLRGDLAGHPQLEPAAKLAIAVREELAVGAEVYGSFGPIDDLGRDPVESALAVIDLRGGCWDLQIGAGWTWGQADHAVAKLIFGFHP